MERQVKLLPKAHLHLHLEGAMRVTTLAALCDKYSIAMPPVPNLNSDKGERYINFDQFKDLYLAAVESLRQPEDMERVVREVVQDAANDGVRWLELHFYAGFEAYRRTLGSPDIVWAIVRRAAVQAGQDFGVKVGFIAAAERYLDPADAVETAQLAVRMMQQSRDKDGAELAPIVGFGLQGPEEGFPPQPFKEAYSVALAGGLKSVPHAGEHGGADSVEGALDCLGAHRVGHGVRAVEGGEQLLARMAQQKVCCDVCPTSNVLLGVSESIAKHQLRALLSSGVPCTISADDPLLFGGVGVADEYEALRNEMQMSDEELAELARSSFIYSGCPDQALLNEGLSQIDAWLKTTKSC